MGYRAYITEIKDTDYCIGKTSNTDDFCNAIIDMVNFLGKRNDADCFISLDNKETVSIDLEVFKEMFECSSYEKALSYARANPQWAYNADESDIKKSPDDWNALLHFVEVMDNYLDSKSSEEIRELRNIELRWF